jgi:hypothetical protein
MIKNKVKNNPVHGKNIVVSREECKEDHFLLRRIYGRTIEECCKAQRDELTHGEGDGIGHDRDSPSAEGGREAFSSLKNVIFYANGASDRLRLFARCGVHMKQCRTRLQ